MSNEERPYKEEDTSSKAPDRYSEATLVESFAAFIKRMEALESKLAQTSPSAGGASGTSEYGKAVSPPLSPDDKALEACRGSVCFVLCSDEDIFEHVSGRIYIAGPTRCYEKKLDPGRREMSHTDGTHAKRRHELKVLFTELPESKSYNAYVSVSRDLVIDSKCRVSCDGQTQPCTLGDEQKISFDIKSSCETRIELDVKFRESELEVIVERIDHPHGDRKDRISDPVRISLIEKDKVIACGSTENGCKKFPLRSRGPYYVEAQPTVNLKEGGLYKILSPGRVMVFPNPEQLKSTVTIKYARASAEVVIGPGIQGTNAADQVEMALFRDGDKKFSKQITWQSGSSSILDDLKQDLYTLVINESATLELVTPRLGYERIQLGVGQKPDLAKCIQFRARKDTTNLSNITGQVEDAESNPVTYAIIELLDEHQQILKMSFTDENGMYSFYTYHQPAKLAIRIDGHTVQLPSASTGAAKQPAAVDQVPTAIPEILPPETVVSSYPNLLEVG